jgi:mono/diheme cytochrome c family protein
MKRYWFVALVLVAAVAGPGLQNISLAQRDTGREQIERGRYLVENVAQCIQCHTPRERSGNLLRSQWLQGGPIPVDSPYSGQPWARRAPNIAGLGGFGPEGTKHLLMTGIVPRTGRPPQAPMPPFRMDEEDADAVVAYLMSLRQAN